MEAIIELGKKKVGGLDVFLATIREVCKRLGVYEERITPLRDAGTTFAPSMLIALMDGEVLQLLRMTHASGDFEKMCAAVEEFRLIKKSAGGKCTLRQMRERDNEPEEPDPDAESDQWAVDAAAALNTTPETLLAAIG